MIQIKAVTKKYGTNIILENCSYTFPMKGIVCLMGASGGGKSTLLNLIAGFDSDYTGEINVGGVGLNTLKADELCSYRKEKVGFIFQDYHLLAGYTAIENVLLASELSDETQANKLAKAKAILSKLGLGDKANQKGGTLSGGQKQRVAIARALMSEPEILFADEPTGALDRSNSIEIMKLLTEIAKDRLVIVITHDLKIGEYADEIIHIQDHQIVIEKQSTLKQEPKMLQLSNCSSNNSTSKLARHNFKTHIARYLGVSIALSIGILAFLFSLSFNNVMQQSIENFKVKNTAFNNGYIKGVDETNLLESLQKDERLEHVYYQYKLENMTLSSNGKTVTMLEKFPTAKASEDLSYGVIPRINQNEIALTPSLGKKFDSNIKNLIGKELVLELDGNKVVYTVSGIYNAGYDDFIISSDQEIKLYENKEFISNYSLSYDVKDFNDIVSVNEDLKQQGINPVDASKEVEAFQATFETLSQLFLVISILILTIGLFLCGVLLSKLQNSRFHEVGLLSALGFSQKNISKMIAQENVLLCIMASIVNCGLLAISMIVSKMIGFPFTLSLLQLATSILATFMIVYLMSYFASYKLVRTEPAIALRK